ncbi:MAG TPA: SPOR domain-containing protein [Verrucomicrobiae bacterium]|nr:SPOR domain-containing protein [Verrucomicrobiae bacterium]
MTQHERRQYSRKTLNPLPHINLPYDNGGIVLDVSEQGLRFRATAPLKQSGPIPFSFTSHSKLVTGIGELVWMDKAKKTGGLRFTELPYSALEQIRKLPQNTNLRPGISHDLTLHIPAPDESAFSITNRNGISARLASKVVSELDRLLPESFMSKVREGWLPVLGNALAKLRALSPEAYFQKQNRWLFKTTFALFLGIVISTLVYVDHRPAGELLIRLGTKLAGGVNTLTPAPATASLAPRVEDVSAYKSNVDGPAAQAVPQSVTSVPGKTAEEISAGTPAPQAQEATVRLPKPGAPRTELVVQVAALKEEGDARELTDQLRQKNFQAFVGTLPVDSFYRVMLGPYADHASARVVLDKLKKAGFDSFIRREPVAERLGS